MKNIKGVLFSENKVPIILIQKPSLLYLFPVFVDSLYLFPVFVDILLSLPCNQLIDHFEV